MAKVFETHTESSTAQTRMQSHAARKRQNLGSSRLARKLETALLVQFPEQVMRNLPVFFFFLLYSGRCIGDLCVSVIFFP